jgi:MFS family permease
MHKEFAQTERTMKVLLTGVLLSHVAFYMVLPILPIYLNLIKGYSIAQIGLILAVSSFSFQGGSVLGGFLSDRFGRRMVISLGAYLRAIGLAGIGLLDIYSLVLMTAIISGIGGGLNAPSTKAAIAALVTEDRQQKTTAFALRGVAANIGTFIAGLFVYFILGGTSVFVFYVASALFIILGLMSRLLLPPKCGGQSCDSFPLSDYAEIIKYKAFVIFSLLTVFLWALHVQFSLAVPIRAMEILPEPSIVSIIWTINSAIVILLQGVISKKILIRINPLSGLALGILFIGAGLSTIYWANSFYFLAMSGILFIIGEMMIIPTLDITISKFAGAKMVGMFFGLANFIMGLGEGAGEFVGGQLLSLGTTSSIPWFVYGTMALVLSFLFVSLRTWEPMKLALEENSKSKMNPIVDKGYETKSPLLLIEKLFGRKKRSK